MKKKVNKDLRVTVSISLPPDLMKMLDNRCTETFMSRSGFIVQAVRKELERS